MSALYKLLMSMNYVTDFANSLFHSDPVLPDSHPLQQRNFEHAPPSHGHVSSNFQRFADYLHHPISRDTQKAISYAEKLAAKDPLDYENQDYFTLEQINDPSHGDTHTVLLPQASQIGPSPKSVFPYLMPLKSQKKVKIATQVNRPKPRVNQPGPRPRPKAGGRVASRPSRSAPTPASIISRPSVRLARPIKNFGDDITIGPHEDFLSDITIPSGCVSGTVLFGTGTPSLGLVNPSSLPLARLNILSRAYARYQFVSFEVFFVSQVSGFSASSSVGAVTLFVDDDVTDDPGPISGTSTMRVRAASHIGAREFAIWETNRSKTTARQQMVPGNTLFYNDVNGGFDVRFNYQGRIILVSNSTISSSVGTIGSLYCRWRIRFCVPEIENAILSYLSFSATGGGTAGNTTAPFGTVPVVNAGTTQSWGYSLLGGATASFFFPSVGTFLITTVINGTGLGALTLLATNGATVTAASAVTNAAATLNIMSAIVVCTGGVVSPGIPPSSANQGVSVTFSAVTTITAATSFFRASQVATGLLGLGRSVVVNRRRLGTTYPIASIDSNFFESNTIPKDESDSKDDSFLVPDQLSRRF